MSDMLERSLHPADASLLISRKQRSATIWRIATVSSIVLLASAATYPFLPRSYTATADILVQATNKDGAATWDQSVADALDDNAVQTKIDILRSMPLQTQVIQKHDLLADPEFNPSLQPSWIRDVRIWLAAWMPAKRSSSLEQVNAALLKRLNVKRERKSYLMQVGYESHDPVKAAALTNTLAQVFVANQIERKVNSHQELLGAFSDRVKALEAKYHTDEKAENDFATMSGLVHRADKDSMLLQLASLSTAVAEAHRKAVDTAARAEMLASQRGAGVDNTTEALASPMLQRLRERLVELSTGTGTGVGPSGGNQTVLGFLRSGIEAESQHLIKAAQNDASVAQQAESQLRAEIARLDARLVIWQANERHKDDLHRAVMTDLDALKGANDRYMQEAGRGDILQADVGILSIANTPDRPSFPNSMLYASGTLALVILLDGLILLPSMMRRVSAQQQSSSRLI